MMQHTEKRGFHIIERDDAFSPEALNENTRKIEAALDEHEVKVDGQVAGLDARVKVFEAHKLVAGVYQSPGTENAFIDLGFTPEAVIVTDAIDAQMCYFTVRDERAGHRYLRIVENGILLAYNGGLSANNGRPFCFFAFA